MDVKPKKIRVLIADDHPVVRVGLKAIIDQEVDLEVVAEGADGQEALELWREHCPDLAVFDVRMPKLSGIEGIEKIRKLDANAKVIIFSAYSTNCEIKQAIKAGAKSYLSKEVSRKEFLETLRGVHRGKTYFSTDTIQQLSTALEHEEPSDREQEVLGLLALGKSNKEIATQLFISETTVKSHLRSIFSKLKAGSRTEAVSIARERGHLSE